MTDQEVMKMLGKCPLRGLRFNVIRRPLSGGAGTIRRHKATKNQPEETEEQFYERLSGIIGDAPETYFFRWNIAITPADVDRFRRECLDPILEQLSDWWQLTLEDGKCRVWGGQNSIHYRYPFGIYNSVDETGWSDVDDFLATGSTLGLNRATTLFPELEEVT
jgi:hypothetical protein